MKFRGKSEAHLNTVKPNDVPRSSCPSISRRTILFEPSAPIMTSAWMTSPYSIRTEGRVVSGTIIDVIWLHGRSSAPKERAHSRIMLRRSLYYGRGVLSPLSNGAECGRTHVDVQNVTSRIFKKFRMPIVRAQCVTEMICGSRSAMRADDAYSTENLLTVHHLYSS